MQILNEGDWTEHPELATEEDIACGLQYWARLFKAETWEDLHMLSSEYKVFEDITDTVEQALADKKSARNVKPESVMNATASPSMLPDIRQVNQMHSSLLLKS